MNNKIITHFYVKESKQDRKGKKDAGILKDKKSLIIYGVFAFTLISRN
jgi:hypothetical protein